MTRKIVNSFTYRQYSFLQAIGWLILGNICAGNFAWWFITVMAIGITFAFGAVNELIRLAARLPRDRPVKP